MDDIEGLETTAWAIERAEGVGGRWKLLVLAQDWCGYASNTVPVLARFAEAAGNVDLRILKRDENLELMDRWLTGGSRSIPMAIVLDPEFEPVGSWGPRPAELQEFVISEKRSGEAGLTSGARSGTPSTTAGSGTATA